MLAAVLVASGIGKLRHPEGTAEAFVALNVPDALNRSWIIRSHPWAEIALAALLLALPHPASVAAAALALALFTAYLLLVWRVVASGEEASCNCFGSVGSSTVDWWTVARNALLVVVSLVVLLDAALGGSALAHFGDLGEGWWWVVGLVVTAAVTYLVTRDGASEPEVVQDYGPEEDYLRLPIPDVAVRVEEGAEPVSLRDLAGERAQVLLLLNPGCGPCKMITGKVADWARKVPEIDFRVLHAMTHENMRQITPLWEPFYVEEVGGSVGAVFGNPGRPSAVLLGMDGLLAGGPVLGMTDVEQLVADITEQIAPAREALAEAEAAAAETEGLAVEAERLEVEAQWQATEEGAAVDSTDNEPASRAR